MIARIQVGNFAVEVKKPAQSMIINSPAHPDMPHDVLVYIIENRLYVNLTNRCTADCVFCRRESSPVAAGYNLGLAREHDISEYIDAIGDPRRYAEIVFCGFGEPTLRLEELLEIARVLKPKGARLRLNTNGHGNLIHGRNIVPDLARYLDEISVSLDAPDSLTYTKIVRPTFGESTFEAAVDFVRACVGVIPKVTITAVDLPGVDLDACRRLAAQLGAQFRRRQYREIVGTAPVGEPPLDPYDEG